MAKRYIFEGDQETIHLHLLDDASVFFLQVGRDSDLLGTVDIERYGYESKDDDEDSDFLR